MTNRDTFSIGKESREGIWGTEFLMVLEKNLKKLGQKEAVQLLERDEGYGKE
ncbi:MAG: hypothetical protein PHE61_04430 [Candidatus Omnitrophica bacterium]|nr:hypothetical protein [Candidatus Omnitrophota bacterium]